MILQKIDGLLKNKWFQIVLYVILFGLFMVPFLYLSVYNFPGADDFARANFGNSINSYLDNIVIWYNDHNGRYFNAIISCLPIYNLTFYKGLFWLISFLFCGTFAVFGKQLFPDLKYKTLFLYSTFIIMYFLIKIPSVVQGFYWLAAVTAYLLSFILFLNLCSIIFKIYSEDQLRVPIKHWVITFVLTFAIVGSHEIAMVTVDFCLALLILYSIVYKRSRLVYSFVVTIFSVICSACVYFAPGSAKRQDHFQSGRNLSRSLLEAFEDSIVFFKHYLIFDTITVLLSVVTLIFFCIYFAKRKITKNINPLYFVLVSFSFVFINCFVVTYSLGSFEPLSSDRTTNMMFFYFVISWLLVLYTLSRYLVQNNYHNKFTDLKWLTPIFLVYVVYYSYSSSNIQTAYNDLNNGVAKDYYNTCTTRLHEISITPLDQDTVYVPIVKNYPATVFFDDLKEDSNHWINLCFGASYANGRKIKLYDPELKSYPSWEEFNSDTLILKYTIDENFSILINKKKRIMGRHEIDKFIGIKANTKIDRTTRFFLHVYPIDVKDLHENRIIYKFDNLDFQWDESKKTRIIKLPDYKIDKICIGQFNDVKRLWERNLQLDVN